VSTSSDTVLLAEVLGVSGTSVLGWSNRSDDVVSPSPSKNYTMSESGYTFMEINVVLARNRETTTFSFKFLITLAMSASTSTMTFTSVMVLGLFEVNAGVGVNGGVDGCSSQGESEFLTLDRHLGD
jgi:hypothetical protein